MKTKIATATAGSIDSTWLSEYVKSLNPTSLGGDGNKTSKILEEKRKIDHQVVERMIYDYLSESKTKNLDVKSNHLSLDFYDNCLMVWLEVDDKTIENKYKEIEGVLNEKYKITGFYISSTIVSDWAGLPCPPNYHAI